MPNKLPADYETFITMELELARIQTEMNGLLEEFCKCKDHRKLTRLHLAISALKEAISLYNVIMQDDRETA
jgi:hypothetical protein